MGFFNGPIEELVTTCEHGLLFTGKLQKEGFRSAHPARIDPEHSFIVFVESGPSGKPRLRADRLTQ